VAIVQISRITQRKGLFNDLPEPLASAELGWATDTRQLFIGNGTLADGAPVVGNTEILTEFSDVLGAATAYTYQGDSGGYTVQTGTGNTPVSQSLQSRLDSVAIITDFGATGDGVTDVTANINNALYQLYCRNGSIPQTRRGLYFPAGTYIISNTLNIPPYCNLYGDGPESTIISFYVATWTDTTQYASGVLVKDSSNYYRSAAAVPLGIDITNTAYWAATTLPGYIFRTADSLQQTDANIGTNGALPPGKFEISSMKFITNMTHDGCYIEAAQDCSFESVNIAGPETTATVTSGATNTACVRWNTTPGYVCSNIEWNHASFSGMIYGTNTAEQIEGVTFSNCAFDTLYRGVYLGDSVAPAVGPTGFRIIANDFDNIYAEGIVIENVGLNCSAYNVFYDVGNHLNGTNLPSTPVIDINGLNNVSVGDMFERTTQFSSGSTPRIKLNNLNGVALGMNVSNIILYQNNSAGATPYNYANQLGLGTYQRVAGITDTLADNVSSARTLFTFDASYIKAVKIDYTIVRGVNVQSGSYIIIAGTDASGTGLAGQDSSLDNGAGPGVTFGQSEAASVVSWTYTTTSTGTAGNIYYSITKLA
jgi:Pectate lyase superfamily protein